METKPGVKTTEFWVTAIVQVLNLLNMVGAWNFAPNKFSVIVSGVTAAAYAVARGVAKQGVAFTPPPPAPPAP